MNALIEVCEYGSEVFRSVTDIRLCPTCKIKPNCFLIKIVRGIENGIKGHRGIVAYCDLYQRLDDNVKSQDNSNL